MDLISLLPDFGNLAFTILAFIAALTVIVAVHEYGHYIVGRWSGIKADVFSIGMGPVLLARTDKHGTQWQIAAFPIGGYVKFRGDANAASGGADDEVMAELSEEDRRHTMHGAPLWARAATVAAGPIFNFVLSFLIFAGLTMSSGVARDPLSVDTVLDIPGMEQGLRTGDEILSIAGVPIPPVSDFGQLVDKLPETALVEYGVMRGGQKMTVTAPHPFPALVGSVNPQSAGFEAGLLQGDLIRTVNGIPVPTFNALRDIVVNGNGEELALDILREGTPLNIVLTPRRQDIPTADGGFETRWLIGITSGMVFDPATRSVGVWEGVTSGVDRVLYIIQSSLSGLWHMITGAISTCNLSGPIGIAQISGQAAAQGAISFVGFIALLSTAVGMLNLFPVPLLDGGHLAFYAWEAATGKQPSEKVLKALLTIGLAVVLSLMVFGVTNDLFCP
ncbi:regulator of sigma E protease [Aliiroseovarius halocynthiae]|uniref:Zinc metalloprotease n=1 Tax=Aliiroseovarius halocynthiae TaxID=985055 RepID=A0A545SW51_9RHOB|nr:RIP metalloprotease RseP [Aliiroseovarius halocynthiae]TQV69184.1 RIP metalloprotease RseP [Aliiroseovarius halocynthiae]SMR71950.1 regulator of sigma E protease [Aliiroseovarius halocynthiae]